jgi:hypothetical protein
MSINCFRNCLDSKREDDRDDKFRIKKGVRCITREKRLSMTINKNHLPTHSSIMTDSYRIEEVRLKQHGLSK